MLSDHARIEIDGHCYRKRAVRRGLSELLPTTLAQYLPISANEEFSSEEEGLEELSELELADEGIYNKNGSWQCSIPVAPAFYKFLIGKKGTTKNRIESETECSITVPRSGSVQPVKVTGPSGRAVSSAKTQIETLIAEVSSKLPYTHFFSIPLRGASDGFLAFKGSALSAAKATERLEPSIFVAASQLHLTLIMLKLNEPSEIKAAARILDKCQRRIMKLFTDPALNGGNRPCLKVRGLEYMNDDPQAVNVLYGKCEEDTTTARIVEAWKLLLEECRAVGLVTEDELEKQRFLLPGGKLYPKLHVTLINTKLRHDREAEGKESKSSDSKRKGKGNPRDKKDNPRVPIDASRLMTDYENVTLAEAAIDEIHLSKRGPFGPDGYYQREHSIPMWEQREEGRVFHAPQYTAVERGPLGVVYVGEAFITSHPSQNQKYLNRIQTECETKCKT